MEVIGKVIKADEKTVVIQIPRTAACAGCGVCRAAQENSLLEAENSVQAQVGDLVKVFLPEKNFLKASFLAYTLPLLFFLLGYLAGAALGSFLKIKGEGFSIFTSFLFLALSFLALHLLYGSGSPRASPFLPQVKEIISPDAFVASGCDHQTLSSMVSNKS